MKHIKQRYYKMFPLSTMEVVYVLSASWNQPILIAPNLYGIRNWMKMTQYSACL